MLVDALTIRISKIGAAALFAALLTSCGTHSVPAFAPNGPAQRFVSLPSQTARAADAGATLQSMRIAFEGAPVALDVPVGLAINKQNEVFVANHSGTNGQVLVYSAAGKQLATKTITVGVSNPAGLAFDKSGNLYVANYQSQSVTVYTAAGKQIATRTMHTDKNFNPSGVQVDGTGKVWVGNRTNNDISIGEIQIFKGTAVVKTAKKDLVYPLGIAFAPGTKDAWVGNSETPNDAMTVLSPSGGFLKKVSTPGFVPTYDAYNKSGNLYVTNGLGAEIEVFNSSGAVVQTITSGLDLPYGIAFNSNGDFFVANAGNNTITEYNASGTLIKTIH